MHSFKVLIKGVAALVSAAAVLWLLDFCLYPCTFMRNDIHSVTTQSYDDVYMGTSHGKMGIDPDSMYEVTGRTGHNLCVGGEYSKDTYYMAKLMIEKGCKPQRIVYEVSPGYFVSEKEEGNNYLLFYHEFPLSAAKLSYYANALLPCNFRTTLFPWYEYPLGYELKNLKKTASSKVRKDYSVKGLKSETQEYHESGFIERYPVDEEELYEEELEELDVFEADEVKEENIKYLKRLMNLCKEEGIEFAAVTTPIPDDTLEYYEDAFGEAGEFFSALFEKYGVPYYDFNSDEYYDLYSHDIVDYTDYDGHLNGDAAREFSKILAKVLG